MPSGHRRVSTVQAEWLGVSKKVWVTRASADMGRGPPEAIPASKGR